MAGRTRRTIGDYFELCRGNTYKSALLGQSGPVLLGLGSIQRNGGFRGDSLKTYGGESPDRLLVQPGELYLSLKDVTQSGDLLGAVARLPMNQPIGRLTQDTVKLEPVGNNVPLSYLYWLLRTPQYRSYCRSHATGTTNLGLAREDFLSFPALEPTQQQSHLAETLDALEDKIELNRRMNETLEAIARAMFKSWFVDFDLVRAKMSGEPTESICQRLGLTPDLLALFPDRLVDSELGEIPEGWRVDTVDSEFNLTMGQSPPGSTYNESGEGLPFYQGRTDFGFRFPTQRVFCSEPTRFADVGDTLVSVRAPVGDINMAAERCCIGRGVAAARHKSGSRSYTYYFMQALEEVFNSFEAGGTVFGSISKKDFHNIQRVTPPSHLITTFEGLVMPIDEKVFVCEREARNLATLRDTFLPKLLSGELRVPDAVNLIEDDAP